MTDNIGDERESRIESAVGELRALIHNHFPGADISVSQGEAPTGVYLDVRVDLDDPDQVMDMIVDRLLQMQVEEGLPVHVVPLRSPALQAAMLAHQADAASHSLHWVAGEGKCISS